MVYTTIKEKFFSLTERDQNLNKTLFTNFFAKFFSVLTNLIIVPLTLNYLGASRYGFFITVLTFLNWVLFFDFGIGNSVKNMIAIGYAKNDSIEIDSIFSNSVFLLAIIFFIFSIFFFFILRIINWQLLFNIKILQNKEIYLILLTSIILFLFNMFFSIGSNIFYAIQKGYIANLFSAVGNIFTLTLTFIAVKFSSSIIIIIVAFISGNIIGNMLLFRYIFNIKDVNISFSFPLIKVIEMKKILNLGIKFFGSSLIGMIIYTADNIIITQRLGPDKIAIYNPIMRLFQLLIQMNGLFVIALWPAFTNAITHCDWDWIKRKLRNSYLKILFLFFPPILSLMFFGPIIIKMWLRNNNNIPPYILCICIGIWTMIYLFNQIFSSFLNGAGIMGKQIKYGVLSIILFVIFGISLVDRYGLVGLSIAGIISSSVGLVVNPLLISQFLKNSMKKNKKA